MGDGEIAFDGTGLSPPTRGNHALVFAANELARSIPAHAGEPDEVAPQMRVDVVYPRPRGGTFAPP